MSTAKTTINIVRMVGEESESEEDCSEDDCAEPVCSELPSSSLSTKWGHAYCVLKVTTIKELLKL